MFYPFRLYLAFRTQQKRYCYICLALYYKHIFPPEKESPEPWPATWSLFNLAMKPLFCCNAIPCRASPLFWLSDCVYSKCFTVLKRSQVEQNSSIHYIPSLRGSESNWSLTKAATSDCSEIKGFAQDLGSDSSPFCPLGQTPLPLQTSASGQGRSSASGPGHWLCSSSLGTGRPESRSKQARKRLWTESILMPPGVPAWEGLWWGEAEGAQGEQGVHSDHSLRRTEKRVRG